MKVQDEYISHIHAMVISIVTGEHRKAKEQAEDERSYRKNANTVRLCVDDVLTRKKLVTYHDYYARVMGKYGLQRGVDQKYDIRQQPNITVI